MSNLFEMSFVPNKVFVDSKDTLKFVAQNKSNTDPVDFKAGRGGDSITVEFPQGDSSSDLVSDLSFKGTVINKYFVCNLVGNKFIITATQNTQIGGGESLDVNFNDMPINTATGDAKVKVSYFIGSDSGSNSPTISKKAQVLGVIAWLDPLVVGLNQNSLLQFKSVASTSVVVSGYPEGVGEKTFDTPPYSGSDNVGVGADDIPQRIYTVTAWADGNQSQPETLALTQVPPVICEYSPKEELTVKPDEKVELKWRARFGDGNTLQWLQSSKSNAQQPYKVIPGEDLTKVYNVANNNAQFMPESVTYTLTVEGYKAPVTQKFQINVNPVQLKYLKYENDDLTGIVHDFTPSSWAAVALSYGNNSLDLTIFQPGYKKDEYHLSTADDVHPMIQFFEAKDGTLKWITANLKTLSLNVISPVPSSTPIDDKDIKTGTCPVPGGAGTIELVGEGNNGQSIRSELKLN